MSDHHSEHPPYQQHHFESMQQQNQSTLLGMWLFLVQEIMFFGGLFGAYTFYRASYPEAYIAGSDTLSVFWGTLNTVILIGSSLTMVFSVAAARKGNKKGIMMWLIATMALGGAFLGVKSIEYKGKWDHQLVPGKYFNYAEYASHKAHDAQAEAGADEHHEIPAVPKGIQIYFSLYFVMTGMHALHMIIGVGIGIWILILAYKDTFSPGYYPHVDYFGLYWHFVDIVWIFLFPLLYLI